jgi:alkanesulfonate monooxygenase SsuD/methylene tetrahydromethanopterin reductase-like flavin-dependent oxidoreductase (luciferase family)
MKIGLMHLTPYSKADPALVAKRAEELGFESYWVGDHTIIPVTSSVQYPGARDGHVPDVLWQLPDPLLALARAGATTSRIKLGTGVCLVPQSDPDREAGGHARRRLRRTRAIRHRRGMEP